MKGAKGAGFEYWSPRPGNKGSDAIGATAKKMTHKAERQQNKASAINATGYQTDDGPLSATDTEDIRNAAEPLLPMGKVLAKRSLL
jgi:hypothetical protein